MRKKTNILEIYNELKKKNTKVEYTIMVKEIMLLTGWKKTTVVDWIKTMKEMGLIKKVNSSNPFRMEFIIIEK